MEITDNQAPLSPPDHSIDPELGANPPSASKDRDEYTSHTDKSRKKFRFKSSKSRSSRSSRHDSHRESHRDSHSHSHRHSRSHRHNDHNSHRRKHHKTRARTPSPNTVPSYPGGRLSPNTAFRESLFDALGDDEGAAFWEGVYGQPIHSFAAPPGQNGSGAGENHERSELDQLNEEDYAAYVRSEMWKRTREGMLEEQERLRAEKRAKAAAEKAADAQEERRRFERAMEDSLRRGRERKKAKEAWRGAWESYLRSWEDVEKARKEGAGSGPESGSATGEGTTVRGLLFWPVNSGRRRDVSRENVEEFMRRAPPQGSGSGLGAEESEDLLLSTLKAERVRWHPDKIQHRYGALGIDESVMRSVTEVFQIIDHMWNELKK
ncbi:hypothetical protein BJY04DRAFT_200568 [Aspergillus karnatakaensis]|uniref:uncharacterized protein n=1 Tax=Aspergillus karnatakaensis TaxID=1810916 RepID=UPI003CCCBB09